MSNDALALDCTLHDLAGALAVTVDLTGLPNYAIAVLRGP
jgi:hypothetical protein